MTERRHSTLEQFRHVLAGLRLRRGASSQRFILLNAHQPVAQRRGTTRVDDPYVLVEELLDEWPTGPVLGDQTHKNLVLAWKEGHVVVLHLSLVSLSLSLSLCLVSLPLIRGLPRRDQTNPRESCALDT